MPIFPPSTSVCVGATVRSLGTSFCKMSQSTLKMKNKYMNCLCNKKYRSDFLMSSSSMQGRAGFNWGTFNLKLLSTSVLVRGNLHCSLSASWTKNHTSFLSGCSQFSSAYDPSSSGQFDISKLRSNTKSRNKGYVLPKGNKSSQWV